MPCHFVGGEWNTDYGDVEFGGAFEKSHLYFPIHCPSTEDQGRGWVAHKANCHCVAPIGYEMSLQIDIYNKLKNAIIYGELSPGEKLSENELAKKLSSSRTPIRETFRQLQMEGYITVLPNKGAYVSKLPLKEIEDIYNIISLLEGYASELAALKIRDQDINKLNKLKNKLVFYAAKKKYRDYVEKNTEFHHLITRLSGNNNLVKINTDFRTRIYRYRLISVTIPGYLDKYASDHEKIINAMSKRDSVRAGKHMREHVNFVKMILVNFLKENLSF